MSTLISKHLKRPERVDSFIENAPGYGYWKSLDGDHALWGFVAYCDRIFKNYHKLSDVEHAAFLALILDKVQTLPCSPREQELPLFKALLQVLYLISSKDVIRTHVYQHSTLLS